MNFSSLNYKNIFIWSLLIITSIASTIIIAFSSSISYPGIFLLGSPGGKRKIYELSASNLSMAETQTLFMEWYIYIQLLIILLLFFASKPIIKYFLNDFVILFFLLFLFLTAINLSYIFESPWQINGDIHHRIQRNLIWIYSPFLAINLVFSIALILRRKLELKENSKWLFKLILAIITVNIIYFSIIYFSNSLHDKTEIIKVLKIHTHG